MLRTPVPLRGEDFTTYADFAVEAGERVPFVLTYRPSHRFCWLRDATFTLQALLGTGFVAEARAWREWLLRAAAGDPADLQIMYGIDGTRRLPEYTLDWLAGYAGSRPVRVGDRIQAEVCERGYDAERGTFTQFYGSKGLDAALLLIPRVGFLPWHDPRGAGTVDAVQRELRSEGFLLRYQPQADGNVDGLPGAEGAFTTCTFWLADALYGIGREREAHELFERLLGLRNDLGLLSEEYDPTGGRQLGNTPQAFSHVGLVNAARHLSGTRSARHPTATGTSTPGDER